MVLWPFARDSTSLTLLKHIISFSETENAQH